MQTPHIILTFHGIGTAPQFVPTDELPYWIKEEEFKSYVIQAAHDAQRLGVALTITFDDGNLSDIEIAAPVLQANDLRGIFFPCAGRIGSTGYLDAGDIQALSKGGFEVGSHGMDHLPWATLDEVKLRREQVEAKASLEAALKQPVNSVALPFGSYNRRVLNGLRQAGFNHIYSSDPGLSQPKDWFIHRFSYRQGRSLALASLLAQNRGWRPRLAASFKHRLKALR